MPNRIIKETVCTSDTLDCLSWFEEVVWYRLIVNCDDYGRMDARPAVLKSRLFPLKSSVTEKSMVEAINKLSTVGLVTLYVFEGKPLLQLVTWDRHQQIRAKKSKYPSPMDGMVVSDITCNQMISDDIKCSRNPIQSKSKTVNTPLYPPEGETPDAFAGFSPTLKAAVKRWLAYKQERRQGYKPQGLAALLKKSRETAAKYGDAAVCEVIDASIANGYQGITWDRLKQTGPPAKQNPATSYPQRQYTDADLESVYVNLD